MGQRREPGATRLDQLTAAITNATGALDRHTQALNQHTAATSRLASSVNRLAGVGEQLRGGPTEAATGPARRAFLEPGTTTLRQLAQDLHMDAKTLRRHLEKAGIDPTKSAVDRRAFILDGAQVATFKAYLDRNGR